MLRTKCDKKSGICSMHNIKGSKDQCTHTRYVVVECFSLTFTTRTANIWRHHLHVWCAPHFLLRKIVSTLESTFKLVRQTTSYQLPAVSSLNSMLNLSVINYCTVFPQIDFALEVFAAYFPTSEIIIALEYFLHAVSTCAVHTVGGSEDCSIHCLK